MKTLSFHNAKIGRNSASVLLELDSQGSDIEFKSGVHLLVAPNGYGKSTLLQTLAGAIPPVSGSIKLEQKQFHPETEMTYVSEYLQFPKFIYPSEWIEHFAGAPWNADLQAKLKPRIQGFRLESLMGRYLGRLSQGERRKITWLAADASPKSGILLDEPLDGLDLLAIETARQMIRDWRSQGRILLIVAHQVAEFLDLSDQVWLFKDRSLLPWSRLGVGPAASTPTDEFRRKILEFYSP